MEISNNIRSKLKEIDIDKIDKNFNIKGFKEPKTDIYDEEQNEMLLEKFIKLGEKPKKDN